jgi:hypothetical protein
MNTDDQGRDQIWNQIREQTGQVWGQVLRQIQSRVGGQLWERNNEHR